MRKRLGHIRKTATTHGSAILGILFYLLIAIPILYLAHINWIKEAVASAGAILTLVAVNLYYARELEKQGKITRESLEETRKERKRPYIIWMVSQGFDKLNSNIENCRDTIKQEEVYCDRPTVPDIPSISTTTKIHDSILTDIRNREPELMSKYNKVEEDINDYRSKRSELLGKVINHLSKYADNILKAHENTKDHEEWESFLSDAFHASDILAGKPVIDTESSEQLKEVMDEIYKLEEFEGEITELSREAEEIESKLEELYEDISAVRDKYVNEYNILETQIALETDEVPDELEPESMILPS